MNPPSLIADLLGLLDTERRYEFEERAGTIEFDGQLPRDQAEVLALIDLLRSHPAALIGVTVFEVDRGDLHQFILTTDDDYARERFAALDVGVLRIVNLAELIESHFGEMASITAF